MSTDPLRVGVVGLGMGMGHVEAYRHMPGVEVVALCDLDQAWLGEIGAQVGARLLFSDYREMFARPELDAVSVCLPTALHAPVTISALEHGKHALCEKPMALDASEARAMVAAAEAAGRVLMVSQNRRFEAPAQYLHQLVTGGGLGRLYFVRAGWRRPMGVLPSPSSARGAGVINRNWFNQRRAGGGVLRDLGSHMLDLGLWLMGFPPVAEVLGASFSAFLPAWAAQHGETADAEDLATGMIRLQDGSALQLEVSFGSQVEREVVFLELYGTQGGASWRDGLRVFRAEPGAVSTDVKRFVGPTSSPQAEFVRAIRTGEPPMVAPQESVAVIEVIDRLYAGGIVTVPGCG